MTTIMNMLPIIWFFGCIFVVLVAIFTWRQKKREKRKSQEANTTSHQEEEAADKTKVSKTSITWWVGYGFCFAGITEEILRSPQGGTNPMLFLGCIIFGTLGCVAWCKRRAYSFAIKRNSLDKFFTRIYVPSLWSYVWRGFSIFLALGIVLSVVESASAEKAGGIIGILLVTWILSSLFVPVVPLLVRRKLQRIGFPRGTTLELAVGSGKEVRLDEIPNGQGEFGLDLTNPVPIDGIPLIQFYIRFLLTADNERVQFKRVGSYATPQFAGPTDAYDLFSQSGKLLVRLYVNAYAGGTSEKAPKGFRYFRPFKGTEFSEIVGEVLQNNKTTEKLEEKRIENINSNKRPRVIGGEGFLPTATGADDLVSVSPHAVASMLLRKKELEVAVNAGRRLSDEEQKELVILLFLLGSPGEEPLIKRQELSFEQAKDIRAIGNFTFGQVKSLFTGQGFSRGDMIRFFDDIQSGKLTMEEATHFLEDCKEWDRIKSDTNLLKEDFFAKKLVERQAARTNDPSNN